MDKLLSLQIDGTELELVEGVHIPSPGGVGYIGAGKTVTDVDTKWDGWIDAIVAAKHEERVYGWLEKGRVHLLFKTEAEGFDFQNAKLTTKEEADGGVRIVVDYLKD